ncbi:MFS transporter [Brachyspira murdochii]|uniref:MFS transporter n=1 Tax=Brachyspira murdochii TaxID=84378 RepID=UPI0012F52742|nr:MFS transporter [Brachyspira murdochii]
MIILIYSMPFLIYLCSSIFSTVLVINASKMGATPFFISMLGVSYGMGMMITAGIFSKIKIPKKYYTNLIYIEAIMQMIISALCLIFMPMEMSIFYSFLYGCSTTIFFVCFQSSLDIVSKDLPMRLSGALFIFSWSLGFAVGPSITGLIYDINYKIGFYIVIAMSFIIFIFFYLSRHIRFKANRIKKFDEPFMRAPRYKVYIGWLIIFVGALVLHTLRFMFLDYGIKEAGLSEAKAATLVGSLSAFMAVGTLAGSFYLRFLEKKRVFTIVGLLTPIALTLILISKNFYVFIIAFMFLGLVSGFGYFFGLYYALADQENSASNVAVNEALTGVAALFIPFSVGYLASHYSYFAGFLFMMIVSLICYIIAIVIMHKKRLSSKEKLNNNEKIENRIIEQSNMQ